MAERNPFIEEDQLEDETEEIIIALLALAFVQSVSSVSPTSYNPSTDFNQVQTRFRNQFSEVLTDLNNTSREAIRITIERISRDFGLSDLSVDFTDERFSLSVRNILNQNLDYILQTNEEMYNELRRIALDNNWTDEEIARRLKRYYGMVPNHLHTVINMESALAAEGVSKRKREELVEKRINRLVEWRLKLISNQLSTGTVESSKDESFGYLVDTSQIDPNEYEKRWVSVIDEVTTDTCISLNNTRAPIGGTFRGGIKHPPSYPPVHECRSAVTLAKRIL